MPMVCALQHPGSAQCGGISTARPGKLDCGRMNPPGLFSAEWGKSLKRRPLPHTPIPLYSLYRAGTKCRAGQAIILHSQKFNVRATNCGWPDLRDGIC